MWRDYFLVFSSSYCTRQSAVMASTTGTALTATHASCLPFTPALGVEGVGLKTQRKVMVVPSAIPPAMPPEI